MKDGIFYPLAILAAIGMIALAMVWPQGLGTTSPAPFGHAMGPPPAPEPDKDAMAKAAAKALTPPPGKAPPKLRPPIEDDKPAAAPASDKP